MKTAAELADKFEDGILYFGYDRTYLPSKLDAEDKAKIITALRAIDEPKWIECSERMPEINRRVLICDPTIPEFPRNDTCVVIGHFRGADHIAGPWFSPDGFGKVTHWQPLPELPR